MRARPASARAKVAAILLVAGPLLAVVAALARAQVAAPAADSSRSQADSAASRADSSRARPDSSLATSDSTATATAQKRDTTHVITTRPAAARKGAPQPEPPYRIEADRMSGGRGPGGDVLYLEKVTITRSRTRLYSERGRYERSTGMVYLEGDVRLRDSTANVLTSSTTAIAARTAT